jgi:hypothetical protein
MPHKLALQAAKLIERRRKAVTITPVPYYKLSSLYPQYTEKYLPQEKTPLSLPEIGAKSRPVTPANLRAVLTFTFRCRRVTSRF